jgi:hypothetical protein
MGIVGTLPARHRTLLVGDAAGLVNLLQGEGIAPAMASGRAAAEAVLAGVGSAADEYRRALVRVHASRRAVVVPIHLASIKRIASASGAPRPWPDHLRTQPGDRRTVGPVPEEPARRRPTRPSRRISRHCLRHCPHSVPPEAPPATASTPTSAPEAHEERRSDACAASIFNQAQPGGAATETGDRFCARFSGLARTSRSCPGATWARRLSTPC